MRATNNHSYGSFKVPQRTRFNPIFIVIAVLFLFCLPLNQIELEVFGIQHPAISLSLLMGVTMICIGLFQVARLEQFTLTRLTFRLGICSGIALIPMFYHHADPVESLWYASGIVFAFLLFCTLQQFSFCYQQRQFLLWIPMISAWLIAFSMGVLSLDGIPPPEETAIIFNSTSVETILLSSLVLSAYILARTHIYKRTLALNHIVLLLTPFVCVSALMAFQEPIIFILTVFLLIFPQPFLFKFSQRLHLILWNISAFFGFFIAYILGWFPSSLFTFSYYSQQEINILEQTLNLIKVVQFSGVGLGELEIKQLLFGFTQKNPVPFIGAYPSWIIAKLAEGGIAVLASMVIFFVLIINRLRKAPNGTHLILGAALMPLFYSVLMTPFIDLNPVLALLLIFQIYWIDNLSTRYHRIRLPRMIYLTPISVAIFIFTSALVFSSVYLLEQSKTTTLLNDKTLFQYQQHPWWSSFYKKELETRHFLKTILKKDKKAQEAYLREQMIVLTKKPTAKDYRYLINAAKKTQHLKIAKQLYIEANLLFPDHFPPLQPLSKKKEKK